MVVGIVYALLENNLQKEALKANHILRFLSKRTRFAWKTVKRYFESYSKKGTQDTLLAK